MAACTKPSYLDPAPAESARVVILAAPLEATLSLGQGTRNGPRAIIRALGELGSGPEKGLWPGQVHLAEPLPLAGLDAPTAVEEIRRAVSDWLDRDKFVLLLGGEHTVSLGAARAHLGRGAPFGVLYLDAHPDLRSGHWGQSLSHACVARRLVEEGLSVVGVGWRCYSHFEYEFWRREDLEPILAQEVAGTQSWIEQLMDRLPVNVYLSLDLDVLDPALMPATCAPAPQGLCLEPLNLILEKLFDSRRVIGADLVELAPIPGQPGPDLTAARLVQRITQLALDQAGAAARVRPRAEVKPLFPERTRHETAQP